MSVDRLVRDISKAVNNAKKQQQNKTWRGQVQGKTVVLGGRAYLYTTGVDIPMSDGDWVEVMISGSRALVIGR
ncbi:hypothetical protein SPFL3102_02662 [Sporomusaceae bacterium FL31]|nr:hypothetical protein SPFL3101_02637 [Sporomusaceae bacterium FL31]GCE34835.1 hypothetical protein SPFL3102_02662 [Sporomusaceae bacterium]